MNREDVMRLVIQAEGVEGVEIDVEGVEIDDSMWVEFSEKQLMLFAALVAAAEKELIAQWVESWGNDLTIKEIVEGIRTDGNGATRPLKHVTREEPL